MKKNIKKIIVGILTFVFLLTGAQSVFASGPFNGQSGDCNPGIGIGVYNVNIPKDSQGCWSATSITAKAGDTINVAMYYHNNTSNPLTNVSGSIVKSSSGPANSYTFTGRMYSDQGSTTVGTVTLNLTSSQSITYSSTHWMKDANAVKSDTDTQVFNNDDGQISIGTVPAGWEDYGEFLAVFKVSNTTVPQLCQDTSASNYGGALPCSYPPVQTCSINSFSANPTSMNSGGSAILSWNTSDCTDAYISSIGNVATSGSQTVYPTSTTTYTLNAHGSTGSTQTKYVTVNVNTPTQTCSINSFSANPTSITSGGSATLSWNTSNCTSVVISNLGYNVPLSGTQTVYPTLTTTYILTAYSPTSGNKTSTATVVVNTPTQNCSISNFTTNTSSIASGDPAILSWNTSNCTSVVISNLGYNVPLSGTQTVYPTTPTTYILTAYGSTGVVQTSSVYINVSAQICLVPSATNYLGTLPCLYYQQPTYNTCRVTSFYADDTSITDGESALLRWNTENCTSVSILGVASGLSSSGSYRIYPGYTKTYTLNAYGTYGSDSSPVTIYVDNYNNNTSYCSISSFTASSTYINSGSPVTLRWNTSGCSSVSISNLGYNVPTSGSQVVYPTSTTNYVLSSYGSNNISRSVQVNVNYVNPIIQPVVVYNSNVVTTVATNISQTGAQLNGLITNTSYTNSNVHFEYGTSVNLGLSTATKTLTGNTNFSEYVSGLSPYTIYYFQAVSEGSNGVSRGAIEVFRTLGTVTNTTRTIVVQGTTVVGSESPIMLKIENRYQSIGVNDIIEYTVTYKNIGNVTLTKPILQVIVPKGIILTNYTQGTYAEDTNTLTVQLSDLAAGEEGFINLQGQVVSMPSDTAQIVTTAVLVYTNKNGSQENAMAYVLNSQKVISNNLLGASAFFSGIFPSSLIGWLFLIILILLLILVARSLYNRRDVTTTTTQKTISH